MLGVIMNPKIVIISAVSQDGVYGIDGRIPWRLKEELLHFKEKTLEQTVVMGRKTWLSLPKSVRPLPGRCSIVISSQREFDGADSVTVVQSLSEAIRLCTSERVYVIGGARLWMEALPLVDEAWITVVERDYDHKKALFCHSLLHPFYSNRSLRLVSVRHESESDSMEGVLLYGIYHWESGAVCSHE